MVLLYEFPPTRSQRAKWALEELGIAYDSKVVDLPGGEQDTAAYREIQPIGAVPALSTDSYTMFESVAIVMQLIEEHPESGLAPLPGTPERAAYYQWCIFAAAEIDPAVMTWFDNKLRHPDHMRPPGAKQDPELAERGRTLFNERAEILSSVLQNQPHMLGDAFTGADIIIGHSCFMAKLTGLIEGFPVLEEYLERLSKRPAYIRAYAGT